MMATSSPGRGRDRSLRGSADLLPAQWSAGPAVDTDAVGLAALLRRHEEHARGWAGATSQDVLVEISPEGAGVRKNLLVRDDSGSVRAWGSTHDRASGRLLLLVVVDPDLADGTADRVAELLFGWAEEQAIRVGVERGLNIQQIDAGAFADDERQYRWLVQAGFARARSWWQMTRSVTSADSDLDPEPRQGVIIRRVERQGSGMPDENDLRTVHNILETSFADHFNSHEETFDEFVFRLREDPGHRWDHWWIAELVDGGSGSEPAGTLVGTVLDGGRDESGARQPDGSYVAYLGVLPSARGRGVAKSLLRTIVVDAARKGRDRVGLEVDADSPTRADALYVSMGWETSYVTESWHREVPVPGLRLPTAEESS